MTKILLIGESCIDIFKYGTVSRLCPEAPCVILNTNQIVENDGMVLNVCNNINSLNPLVVTTVITNDVKPSKIRYVDFKTNNILLREDINDVVTGGYDFDSIDFGQFDAVVVSDYNKGFLSEEDLIKISKKANLSFIDTKRVLSDWVSDFDFIKINEFEYGASILAGFKKELYTNKLIVTLGEKGAMLNGVIYPVKKSFLYDVVGAGDTFMAALVVSYLEKRNIDNAINYANICASEVVKKRGVSTIQKSDTQNTVSGYALEGLGWNKKGSTFTKDENTIVYNGHQWTLNGKEIIQFIQEIPK